MGDAKRAQVTHTKDAILDCFRQQTGFLTPFKEIGIAEDLVWLERLSIPELSALENRFDKLAGRIETLRKGQK